MITADSAAGADWAAFRERGASDLAGVAADVRRSVVEMVDAGRARPHRRRPLGHRHPGRRSTARCSTSIPTQPDAPRPRPVHPEQGPLRRRALRDARALRLLPRRRAGDVHGSRCRALNGHPNRTKVPGRRDQHRPARPRLPGRRRLRARRQAATARRCRTFVVLGDGELQEGSNWEAAMTAGHYGLDNLTAIVDRNRLQQGARTEETNALEPLADKWASFGWEVREVDGHDHRRAARGVRARRRPARPSRVIANTIKGKGVSFMEDRVEWHHKVPERGAGRRPPWRSWPDDASRAAARRHLRLPRGLRRGADRARPRGRAHRRRLQRLRRLEQPRSTSARSSPTG